ncbi:MAG: TetR/AcrR family transcriptional regulator [Chloroflexi bacterium]|nr:MAG: TetR/AcrR family transcriptional regulator [Chloroflexota bacterium]
MSEYEKPKLDRRVRRTLRMLREALLELILEKGYDNISINDITTRADLSRATFYLHFSDKDDLLLHSLEEMFDDLVNQRLQSLDPTTLMQSDGTPPSLFAFQHAAEYKDLYRALLSERGVAFVLHRIRLYMAQITRRQLLNYFSHIPAGTLEFVAQYLAGSLLNMLLWWLENEMPHPPEEMAQRYHLLTVHGLRGLLPSLVSMDGGASD